MCLDAAVTKARRAPLFCLDNTIPNQELTDAAPSPYHFITVAPARPLHPHKGASAHVAPLAPQPLSWPPLTSREGLLRRTTKVAPGGQREKRKIIEDKKWEEQGKRQLGKKIGKI